MNSFRFRIAIAAVAAALAAVLSLAPLLLGPEGWGSRPARFGEGEQGVSRQAGGGSPPPPADPAPSAALAPRLDPRYPVGVELCLPVEHYHPASPPLPAGLNPAALGEELGGRLAALETVDRDLSLRWRGDPAQPFEAVFEFRRRGEGATYHHGCVLLQDAAGRWRVLDYTVQRVSPREDEPVSVLTERSRDWRALERALAL